MENRLKKYSKNYLENSIQENKEYNYELCKKIENIQNELNDLDEEKDNDIFNEKLEKLENLIVEINKLHNFANENQITLYPSSHDITTNEINSNLTKFVNKIVDKKEKEKSDETNESNRSNEKKDNSLSYLLTPLSRMQLIDLKDYIMVSQYEGYVDEYYFEKGMPNDKYHFKNNQKMNYLQTIIDFYEKFFETIAMEIRKR